MEITITLKNKLLKHSLILVDLHKPTKPSLVPSDIESVIHELNSSDLKTHKNNIIPLLRSSNSQTTYILPYDSKKLTTNALRKLGANIGKFVTGFKSNSNWSVIFNLDFDYKKLQELTYGIHIASFKYKFSESKTKQNKYKLQFVTSLESKLLNPFLKEATAVAQNTNYVRSLVDAPPIQVTPSFLAKEATKIAKTHSKISTKILSEKDIIKNKLNLIHAVGKGSQEESKLIVLHYKGNSRQKTPYMIVGKGVTFDAGGLNLKPTNNIENMKMDMAGSATVLGLFKLISQLKLKINLVGIIPSVENLVGQAAYKPGDILTAYNGKTIEITNTDAEGRLILADAISYGLAKYKPSQIIDIATLTGACVIALGSAYTGLMTNSSTILNHFKKASKLSQDTAWPLPLNNYYRSKVKGDISDYKNWTAGVDAGASMGAAFLERFVSKTPWAHLDIAGTASYSQPTSYLPKGATGRPLNLLYTYYKGLSD